MSQGDIEKTIRRLMPAACGQWFAGKIAKHNNWTARPEKADRKERRKRRQRRKRQRGWV